MSAADLWAVYQSLKSLSATVANSGLTTLISTIDAAKAEAKTQLTASIATDT